MARPKKLPADLAAIRENTRKSGQNFKLEFRSMQETLDLALDDVSALRGMVEDLLGALGSLSAAVKTEMDSVTTERGFVMKNIVEANRAASLKHETMSLNYEKMLTPLDLTEMDKLTPPREGRPGILGVLDRAEEGYDGVDTEVVS